MELRAQIEELESALTPAERKLASTLLADYPFAGLQSRASSPSWAARATRISSTS